MKQEKTCRVAYTLDYDQPVLCTIISDQPMFYFEDEIVDEDILDLDDLDTDAMYRELELLKEQLDYYEEQHAMSEPSPNTMLENEFVENKAFKSFQEDISLDRIFDALKLSRTGAAYLSHADELGVKIKMCAYENSSSYNPETKTISISTLFSESEVILHVSKQLRAAWQDSKDILINPLSLNPDDAVLVQRLQAADLLLSMTRIAWELQLAGYGGAWALLESSSTGDIARAMAREAHRDFRTLHNGMAYAAAFEMWFLSARPCQSDKKIIHAMLAMQQNINGFNGEIADHFSIADYIEKLGDLPFDQNYLSQHIEIILQDDIFTEVRNRSTANFLWFLKFERSFQETEQYLQVDGSYPDAVETADSNNAGQIAYDSKIACELVHLFETAADLERKRTTTGRPDLAGRAISKHRKPKSADIIDISARF